MEDNEPVSVLASVYGGREHAVRRESSDMEVAQRTSYEWVAVGVDQLNNLLFARPLREPLPGSVAALEAVQPPPDGRRQRREDGGGARLLGQVIAAAHNGRRGPPARRSPTWRNPTGWSLVREGRDGRRAPASREGQMFCPD